MYHDCVFELQLWRHRRPAKPDKNGRFPSRTFYLCKHLPFVPSQGMGIDVGMDRVFAVTKVVYVTESETFAVCLETQRYGAIGAEEAVAEKQYEAACAAALAAGFTEKVE